MASVTGSITSKLSRLDEFGDILRYLARTLPPQAVFFIQLIMISTTIGLGTEMLRTTALIQSTLRKRVGPRATDRERGLPFLGLRPLCNPRNFLYAKVLANQSLFFMLLFTFVTLSPLICYVLLFSFSMFEIGYRHQFIHVYPPTPDSGGQMWITFLDILLISSVIAELLLFTVTSLADTNVAVFLMIPLIVATILFNVYVRQRHFSVLRNLSAETCVEVDDTRILEEPLNNESSHDWLKDKYLQPALHPEEKRVDLNTQSLGMVHG